MMKKICFQLAALALLSLSACKKDPKFLTSTWKFDGQEIVSESVLAYTDNIPNCYLQSRDKIQFSIFFYGTTFPSSGSLTLADINSPAQDSTFAHMNVTNLNTSTQYIPSEYQNIQMQVSTPDGLPVYTLPATWFVNVNNFNDSVLVEGVFRKP